MPRLARSGKVSEDKKRASRFDDLEELDLFGRILFGICSAIFGYGISFLIVDRFMLEQIGEEVSGLLYAFWTLFGFLFGFVQGKKFFFKIADLFHKCNG